MNWIQWRLTIKGQVSEPLEALLLDSGAVSITYQDAANRPVLEPDPGEIRLWDDLILIALYQADVNSREIEGVLSNLPVWQDVRSSQWEVLEDKDWVRAWMDNYHPMQFGESLWICPTNAEPPNPDAINIMLDPGLAFGSGTHPTTALCLEYLEKKIQGGEEIVDFGCGSGILAIAAVKLGANKAIGTDHDPQAVIASRDNAERNGVSENQFPVFHSDDFHTQPCDGVVANILAETLKHLSTEISELIRPGGWIAMSGILESQIDSVKTVYQKTIDFDQPTILDDWVLLTGTKK
jgi:ribosomal protein L11 methyltransferase